ncbi:hypothetical protein [Streptomyces odonnellii]|uniref:hypothetical protein n=1 Tax=Streptomyces odonnellii TaxID=1417980 RepID=UPI000625C559|nr:hypothetical protein [Streptomyces odonnellii]
MNNNTTPLAPLSSGSSAPLSDLSASRDVRRRVLTLAQLREHGVGGPRAAAECRPGGPWQQLLPGVFLLHPGTPTSEERLRAVLLYAGRPAAKAVPVPAQAGPDAPAYDSVMITGPAALALYGFSSSPGLLSLDRIDVLVPRTRRLRSTGFARLIRAHALPRPEQVTGLPVAPVARAVADAIADLSEARAVVALLTEAVRGGHCEPAVVVRELTLSGLLARPHVVQAVDTLLAEGRTLAEGRLYEMVRAHGLSEPVWNVELRLPGGAKLGTVDAYWPEFAVAVELDTRAAADEDDDGAGWAEAVRKREHLERLGITVVHLTPRKLRESLDQQATVVRTALMTADARDPAARVQVLPR